ncbi:uncharacterized protein FA14DRAFT_65877 [Meira miltonrushii]|uniref:Uncharacterized protein n=1 Tax=Meira miltonrushii TaxID=1280837 RepID=A0A316VC81_9BASI|nr:uncharacterized protein FA14DRAFT_65877 [Meira miltonrushii]PWN33863.1 hypothetical protein FA14DRAFT_65877 [Meira miltonrushii]
MALLQSNAVEKRYRLSTLQAPEWATWSMNAATEGQWKSRNEKAHLRFIETLNKVSNKPKSPRKTSHWSKFSVRSMLQDGSDNAIHASDWKTYQEDESIEIDQDRNSTLSQEIAKLQPWMNSVLEDLEGAIGTLTPEMLKPGYFDYTPLLPIEQERIQRFLRLTGYKPEQPQKLLSELEAFIGTYQQSLTDTSRSLSQLEEESDPLEISQKFFKLQKKVRVDKYSDDYVQGREEFINMCKTAMPTRHTDWILQKAFEDSQKDVKKYAFSSELGEQMKMKSVSDPLESISTVEAIEMVENGTMPFEKAAIVMHALASASNIRTKDILLSKQYSTAANVEKSRRKKNLGRCLTESAALARTMKALFPHFFPAETQKADDDSMESEASIQAAFDTICTNQSSHASKRKELPVNAAYHSTLQEASTSENPFQPREYARTPKEEARLKRQFEERQIILTQQLYEDLEVQSGEDEQYQSEEGDSAELDDNDDGPLDGILDLQDWVETCYTKTSYRQMREHFSDMYDGKIPSWVEERLDPKYKNRLKVNAEKTEYTDEPLQLTNVEMEKRTRLKDSSEEILKVDATLRRARKEAMSGDKKEQKRELKRRFEQEQAMTKAARQARIKQRQKDREQATMERKMRKVLERARLERMDCDRAIYDKNFSGPKRLKGESASDAEERLKKAVEERAIQEIAYLSKTEKDIQDYSRFLRSLAPSLKEPPGDSQVNVQSETSKEEAMEHYNLAKQKWLASLRQSN